MLWHSQAAMPGYVTVREASEKARECSVRRNEYNMRGLFKVQVVG